MTPDDVRALLKAMDLVFDADDESACDAQTLNMNDVWGWATSWGQPIDDHDLLEVGRLVRRYGYCGALYWVSTRHHHLRSEFEDVNRFVEFVRAEETILAEVPASTARAYAKRSYTIGGKP